MELLTQLGINSTALIQFAIFVVTILILRFFVFADFARAADARFQRTKGGEDDAAGMIEKAAEYQAQYEAKAREINAQISQIFQKEKQSVGEQAETIIQSARKETADMIEGTRRSITQQLSAAESELQQEAQALSVLMVKKLLGKAE